ncbi:MAG: 50S ribosomal protein L6 [Armatimonadetes bacterium]|nr:50S ribosomal protein L6 [Armatimonadota bacterium]MDW8153599.1 50S ribosomal protein L6 [Armatimonadota bacterium]
MSRIGRMPVSIPPGVEVRVEGSQVWVRGPKGELERTFHPDIRIRVEDGKVLVHRPTDLRHHRALHGLTRALLANMVRGVVEGYTRELELVGTGYRAALQGGKLVLQLGFSHPVEFTPPPGITLEVPVPTRIVVRGIDKELVGQVAAQLRALRPPDPYKGKGIRYAGEVLKLKPGKAGRAGGRK